MKNFTITSAIILAMTLSCQYVNSQQREFNQTARDQGLFMQKPDGPQYLTNAITVKLTEGTGDFGRQTGAIALGIPSLDEKISRFGIYSLEKRFKYNPAKLRKELPDLSRIYKLSFPESFPVNEVVEAFAKDPKVEYAEVIPIGHLADVPDDSLYSQLQHLPQIFAPQAWDVHKGENGTEEIVIAINDSGVDWDHVDLRDNVWQNIAEDADNDGHTMEYNGTQWVLDPGDLNGVDDDLNGFTDDLLGWNFISNTGDPNPIPSNPFGYHGTHCAGISNGVTNNGTGIASISWNLTLMPICMDQNNTCIYAYDGIIYAAENGADIISNSWYWGYNYSVANQEVISYATGLGSIIIAAAANDNISPMPYPASYQNVISVASVNVDDTKAPYSNFNLAVDISAPGSSIISTVPDNNYLATSGTSMATPCIAGCLGLLKSYHPDWSNDKLITQVLGTADNIDSLNPYYINMLGTGRVNAYRMLSEENVTPFLKLEFLSVTPDDENGNGINEQGENVMLNFCLHNYAQGLGANNVIVSVSTDDPDIIIINVSGNAYIPSDSTFSINNQIEIQVSANASSHVAELTLHFDSDGPILMGEDNVFEVMVAPSGIFVFEGEENGQDYSGAYITGFLDHLGYEYTYANSFPALLGFETVFLSFGNPGINKDKGTQFTKNNSLIIQQYLESGGKLYIEIGGMFNKMVSSGYPNIAVMKQLFGVNVFNLSFVENPIDTLFGVDNTPMEEMMFAGSDQFYNWYIDKLTPQPEAIIPFTEKDYGNVAIMYEGPSYGQKTFYMGYSLAELHDRDATSSRYNVLLKAMQFFGYNLQQGFILSNFIADKTAGGVPLEVHFTDISLTDPVYPILSWQWDFDNDGTIDSDDPNPVWTYYDGGEHTVRLITSNGINSDTLVAENVIAANFGYLVYEGVADGDDYSGAFIRDYLQENTYWVTYRNDFPESLEGFSAVFLSFGNRGSGKTILNDQMASILINYLEDGGYVYLEGGDVLGYDQVTNSQLLDLFGLVIAVDGMPDNPVDGLTGQPGAITNNMLFTGNNQVSNDWIDLYVPSSNGLAAFIEVNFGKVAVQQSVANGRRTFCFSYALSKLTDGEYPNTREELLHRILNFFDIYTDEPELKEIHKNTFNLYPNPAHNKITIESSVLTGNTNLSIITVCGKNVLERNLTETENQIDISALPRGVYFVRLQDEKTMKVEKMIKQ